MGMMHKIGNTWIQEDDMFEKMMDFITIFGLLFIIGTLVYFGFFALFKQEYSWSSYFIFNFIFSILGSLYVKCNN